MFFTLEEGVWEDGSSYTCVGSGLIAEQEAGGGWAYREWRREEMHAYAAACANRKDERAVRETETMQRILEDHGEEIAAVWLSLVCSTLPKWFVLHMWRNGVTRVVFNLQNCEQALEFVNLVEQADLSCEVSEEVLVRLMGSCTAATKFQPGLETGPCSHFGSAIVLDGVFCHKNVVTSTMAATHWDALEAKFMDDTTKAIRCSSVSRITETPAEVCVACHRTRISNVYDPLAITMSQASAMLTT
jgi:hypothetical protein